MITRIILLSLMFSCGPREVKFPTGAEAISPYQVTNAEKAKPDQQGIFTKTSTLNGSSIVTSSKSYPFSEYSSHQAHTYYASKADGSSTQVKYKGDVVEGKMVIQIIEDL